MENDFEKMAREAARFRRPVQLNMWPEERRGAPNAFLRSALFSAGKPPSGRLFHKQKKLDSPALKPYAVSFTGVQLYQPELDVWLHAIHLARLRKLEGEVEFPVRAFLKGINRSNGKLDRERLLEHFMLLRATAIRVSWDGGLYMGGLIDSLECADQRSHKIQFVKWKVRFNSKLADLLVPRECTWLHASARYSLGKSYLAKWLHGFYASHQAKPHPMKVERLRVLSGSESATLFGFRRRLKAALAVVAEAEARDGRVFRWELDSKDRVVVTKTEPSGRSKTAMGG